MVDGGGEASDVVANKGDGFLIALVADRRDGALEQGIARLAGLVGGPLRELFDARPYILTRCDFSYALSYLNGYNHLRVTEILRLTRENVRAFIATHL